MNLTVEYRNRERPASHAAVAEVIAGAFRAGHTVTVNGAGPRHTFALDDHHNVTVTIARLDPLGPGTPADWATQLAASAARLI